MDFNTIHVFIVLCSYFFWSSSYLWPRGESLNWLLNPFDMTILVFEDVLTLWYGKDISEFSSTFPVPDLFISNWYLETTIQVLGILFAFGLVIVPRLFKWTKLKNIDMYVYLATETWRYIYIYVCVWICFCKNVCMYDVCMFVCVCVCMHIVSV